MFDEVFGMAALGAGNFREGVRDTFGASIVADVLDPILNEIDSLRVFNTEFQHQSFSIDRILADARMIQFKNIW
ncbi:hypothetical protein [Pseudomonas aeruginosa]|uniref:hypothetical protein n=1 Tax=Pseudomonas aeruginosa TaxID=287 RepID=UPI0021C75073|nr:hypothetical protein [Pseudomonas aeruginosa]